VHSAISAREIIKMNLISEERPQKYPKILDENDLLTNIEKYGKIISNSS